MIFSADHAFLKSTNKRNIIEALYQNKELSRADLARVLNLSKPAVADNLTPLILNGLVKETGEASPSENGGRKPIMLRINKSHKYIMAIDLNPSQPLFVLGNLIGEIKHEFSLKVSFDTPYNKRVEIITNAINLLINVCNIQNQDLCCIAISSPYLPSKGRQKKALSPHLTEWFKGNLKADLEDVFYNVPIVFENYAYTAAVGEKYFGTHSNTDNLLFLFCGESIGAGIILKEEYFIGHQNNLGDIFNFIDPKKYQNNSCLEKNTSIDFLISSVEDKMSSYPKNYLTKKSKEINFDNIVEAYHHNDQMVLDIISGIAIEISCAAINICNLLCIETLILGGEYEVFKETILEKFENVAQKHCTNMPNIVNSHLGKHSIVYGLFTIARSNYFDLISKKHNDWEYA